MSCIEAVGRVLGNISQASGTITGVTCSVSGSVRGNTIQASGSIVCVLDGASYLRVTPAEVQWVTDTTEITYTVYANVDWRIE